MECNGPKGYITPNFGDWGLFLAEYVKGIDVTRAMTEQRETIFGNEEWACPLLSDTKQVYRFTSISNRKPIEKLFYICGKIANIISRPVKNKFRYVIEMSHLLNQMKINLEEWKRCLPEYYEPLSRSTQCLKFDDVDVLISYPYETCLEYITSIILLPPCLMLSVCGAHNELV